MACVCVATVLHSAISIALVVASTLSVISDTCLSSQELSFFFRGLGRNSRYRSADIPVRLELANAADADKNVRAPVALLRARQKPDRKSTRLNSSHLGISYAVFCLTKRNATRVRAPPRIVAPAPRPPRLRSPHA